MLRSFYPNGSGKLLEGSHGQVCIPPGSLQLLCRDGSGRDRDASRTPSGRLWSPGRDAGEK